MAQAAPQLHTTPNWYEELCQKLDTLRQDSIECFDEGDILPPTELYDTVKQNLLTIGQLSGFPSLDTSYPWLGPDGEIGITLQGNTKELDLIYSSSKTIARLKTHLKTGLEHHLIDLNMVPVTLKQLAA
jgi:hypothetical protein